MEVRLEILITVQMERRGAGILQTKVHRTQPATASSRFIICSMPVVRQERGDSKIIKMYIFYHLNTLKKHSLKIFYLGQKNSFKNIKEKGVTKNLTS